MRMTCLACPLQYDGTLWDGRHFYFRYRGGAAELGVGSNPLAAVRDIDKVHVAVGDPLDGHLPPDEFALVLTLLLGRRLGDGLPADMRPDLFAGVPRR